MKVVCRQFLKENKTLLKTFTMVI